jgi:hypothetical protein
MQQLCIAVQKCTAQSNFSKELLVSQLTVILENLLHHLEFISMDFRRMQLTVHETQRIFLELTAHLDYYNYFHPILSLTQPPAPTQTYIPTTAKVMGAFTTDLMVCDIFFWAGIPVWLVRPYSVFLTIRMSIEQ